MKQTGQVERAIVIIETSIAVRLARTEKRRNSIWRLGAAYHSSPIHASLSWYWPAPNSSFVALNLSLLSFDSSFAPPSVGEAGVSTLPFPNCHHIAATVSEPCVILYLTNTSVLHAVIIATQQVCLLIVPAL